MEFPKFLRIASLPSSEFVNKYTGEKEYSFDHWDNTLTAILAKKFGFSFELISPADGEYGRRLADGNWTGMVGMIQHGQTELIIYRLSVAEHRTEILDYSNPYEIDSLTYATRTQAHSHSASSFMKPFSSDVWIYLLVSTCSIAAAHFLLFHRRHSLQGLLFNSSRLQQPGSASKKFLTGSCMISAMFLRFCYTAVLLSFLIYPSFLGVRTIPDLAAAIKRGQYMCTTTPGTYITDVMLSSLDSYARIIGVSVQDNVGSNDIEEILGNTELPKLPAFIEVRTRLLSLGPKYFVSDDVFFTDFQAIGVKKGFCCKDRLDSAINYIWAAGIYVKLVKDATYRKRLKNMKDPSITLGNDGQSLSIEDFNGVFTLLLMGYMLATFVFLIELMMDKWKTGFMNMLKRNAMSQSFNRRIFPVSKDLSSLNDDKSFVFHSSVKNI